MADEELRGLERSYRASASVEDHARWIAARLRAGRVCDARARLAAELGHEAASAALGGVEAASLDELFRTGIDGAARESRLLGVGGDVHWVMTGERPSAARIDDSLDGPATHLRGLCVAVRLTLEQATAPPACLDLLVARLRAWHDRPGEGGRELERAPEPLDQAGVRSLLGDDARADTLFEDVRLEALASLRTMTELPDLDTGEVPDDDDDGVADDGVVGDDPGGQVAAMLAEYEARIVYDPWALLSSTGAAAGRLVGAVLERRAGASYLALRAAGQLLAGYWPTWGALERALEALAGPGALRGALIAELGPWILGEEAPSPAS